MSSQEKNVALVNNSSEAVGAYCNTPVQTEKNVSVGAKNLLPVHAEKTTSAPVGAKHFSPLQSVQPENNPRKSPVGATHRKLYSLEDFTQEYAPSCRYDGDLIADLPLHLSLDFGGRINCGIVAQELKGLNRINILKDFYVKNPKILSDLIKKIIEYYEPHKASNNTMYLYHDRSGFKSEANSKTTLAFDVEEMFRVAGWKVINLTPNTNNPSHILKFRLISEILEQNRRELPYVVDVPKD